MTRLKSFVTNPVERPPSGVALPFYALEQIESGTGRLMPGVEIELKEDDTAVLHREGDVRFGKLRPYLAKSLLMSGSGSGSGELLVLRSRGGVDSRYLHYLTLSKPFLGWTTATSYGVKMPRTNWESVGAFDCEMPLMDEQRRVAEVLNAEMARIDDQRRIADFLDAETTRVDELIAEQEGTRQLLDERVWSLFVERVLSSGGKKVPLRRVLTRLADGPFGSAFTSSNYGDDGAAVVRLGNIGFAKYRGNDQAFIPLDLYRTFLQHRVNSGDLLIAGLGDVRNHAGRACVAPDLGPAIVKGKCFVGSVDRALASPEFLALFLSSPLGRDAVGEAARGSTRMMINLEIAKSSLVLLPAPVEQVSIASDVIEARSKVGELIREIDRQVDFLREHRQALITAAVTGGLDALQGVA